MEQKRKINAFPAKSFFIKTLVKDIDLRDAIMDLIDNSIDSYTTNRIKGRKKICINLSKDKFVIEDDCGGMRKDSTYEQIFRFGLPTEVKERTIGVYGVGLKRAIFKMGQNILIESDDGENLFSIRIDKEWLEDEENWMLDFESEEKTKNNRRTKICIEELHPNIAKEMENIVFENELRDRIKKTYSFFIDNYVTIEVNGNAIEPYNFEFLCDKKNFAPFHKKYIFDEVEVEILAGYTPIVKDQVYGWNVFCNDRLVVRNDTSYRTGWGGVGGKTYHYPEDNRFLGLVFFRSDRPLLLPWQTTKENIQYDSRVYRKAQVEMQTVTNNLVGVIRLAGRTKDPDTNETIGKALFADIPTRLGKDIREEHEEIVPAIKGERYYERISRMPQVSYIQYTKDTGLIKKVKKKLGNAHMSNKKAGEKTFEYYVKLEEVENE